jgi:peptide/nickel transport system permease protein
MWRSWLWRITQLLLSLACAVFFACALAAFARPAHGFWGYSQNVITTLLALTRGDFGVSSVAAHPALAALSAAWAPTLALTLSGGATALALGIPLGILLTHRLLLAGVGPFLQAVSALPIFALCLLLAWWNARMAGNAFTNVLPSLIVGGAGAGYLQLLLRRTSMVASNLPYRTGLRMMGLSAIDVDVRYVLPEIIAHISNALGEFVLVLLSAVAIVEFAFGIPGAASLFFVSAARHDWAVIALVLFAFAGTKLIADFIGWAIAHMLVAEQP